MGALEDMFSALDMQQRQPGSAGMVQGPAPAAPAPQISFPQAPSNMPLPVQSASASTGGSVSGPSNPSVLSNATSQFMGLASEAGKEKLTPEQEAAARASLQGNRDARLKEAGQVGEAYGQAIQAQKDTAVGVEAVDAAQRASAEEARQQFTDLSLKLRYANSDYSPDDIRERQDIAHKGLNADGSKATPEEQRRAILDLQRAENIDPSRLLSGWRGIVAAGAAFLGGIGSAITHTPNYALDIIKDNIERDIAAQKSRFDLRQKDLGNSINVYAHAKEVFGDERQAILGAYRTKLDAAALVLQKMGATEPAYALQQESIRAGLDMTKEKLSVQLTGLEQASKNAAEQQRINLAQREADKAKPQLAMPIDLEAIGPVDEHTIGQARDLNVGYRGARAALDSVMAAYEKSGRELVPSAAAKEMQRFAKEYAIARNKMAGLGSQLSERELELIQLVKGGDPSAVFSANVKAQLDAASQALDQIYQSDLRGYNIQAKDRRPSK